MPAGAVTGIVNAAVTPVQAAGLARRGLERLIDEHPKVAARLMVVLAQHMAERLRAAGVAFVIEPQLRFAGQPGEQWTMFFRDPSGNPIEIKGFADFDSVYAH